MEKEAKTNKCQEFQVYYLKRVARTERININICQLLARQKLHYRQQRMW